MKSTASIVKTNIVLGMITLIPTAIVFLVLVKIVEILKDIAKSIGLQSATSAGVTILLALLLVFAFCFIVGALVRTRLGAISMETLERKVLNQIPGYKIFSSILQGFIAKETAYPPALIRLYDDGAAALGFVMEENEDATVTVFIPSTPAITIGQLHVVAKHRVTVLDTSAMEFMDSLSQWGVGLGKVLKASSRHGDDLSSS